MIVIISMNIRGLDADLKFLVLKDIFYSARPELILIQETMHNRQASITYFRKMFLTWYLVASKASGPFGGLAALWDPQWIFAKAYKCFADIVISAYIRGKGFPINILNTYVPYKNKIPFWEKFFASNLFDIESLMIAGDLNVTLRPDECWGCCRKMDPLADRIKFELLNKNFVDIAPSEMKPTWDNERAEKAYISKRIDRFIVHVSIIDKLGMPFSSVGNAFVSDHRPIFLSWREKGFRKGYPLKFNRTCLEDPTFNDIISNTWKDLSARAMLPPILTFREKMAAVRKLVKEWKIEKRRKDRQAIQDTQWELDSIIKSMDANYCPFSMKCWIREFERKKHILLKQEESTWRLKSREIWLKEGDRNMKFFHKFANAICEKNTIWKISDGNGGFFVSQQDISREVVRHFKSQYSRREGSAFQDILWGIELVPQMFDDEKDESLF